MIRLGVNIDHVATVRNARGEIYPEPYKAAQIAINSGADSITVHLREDRRHIHDKDLYKIIGLKKIRVNLEMAPTRKMLQIAIKSKPSFACIIDRSNKKSLLIKKNKIISQLKISICVYKKNALPTFLKKIPATKQGSRFLK